MFKDFTAENRIETSIFEWKVDPIVENIDEFIFMIMPFPFVVYPNIFCRLREE